MAGNVPGYSSQDLKQLQTYLEKTIWKSPEKEMKRRLYRRGYTKTQCREFAYEVLKGVLKEPPFSPWKLLKAYLDNDPACRIPYDEIPLHINQGNETHKKILQWRLKIGR